MLVGKFLNPKGVSHETSCYVIVFSVKIEGLENSWKFVFRFSIKHVLVFVKRSTILKSTVHLTLKLVFSYLGEALVSDEAARVSHLDENWEKKIKSQGETRPPTFEHVKSNLMQMQTIESVHF